LERSILREKEETTPEVDFKLYYDEVSRLRPPHLDHATFSGPIVVKKSPGRGRGLFTTKSVKAGELLLCEKAFAHCYAAPEGASQQDRQGSSITAMLINILTKKITVGTQGNLITAIVQKLYANPSLLPKFRELHYGSHKPLSVDVVDGEPIIDTYVTCVVFF
jgi:hypothetical protein